jgi:hypothetical protein
MSEIACIVCENNERISKIEYASIVGINERYELTQRLTTTTYIALKKDEVLSLLRGEWLDKPSNKDYISRIFGLYPVRKTVESLLEFILNKDNSKKFSTEFFKDDVFNKFSPYIETKKINKWYHNETKSFMTVWNDKNRFEHLYHHYNDADFQLTNYINKENMNSMFEMIYTKINNIDLSDKSPFKMLFNPANIFPPVQTENGRDFYYDIFISKLKTYYKSNDTNILLAYVYLTEQCLEDIITRISTQKDVQCLKMVSNSTFIIAIVKTSKVNELKFEFDDICQIIENYINTTYEFGEEVHESLRILVKVLSDQYPNKCNDFLMSNKFVNLIALYDNMDLFNEMFEKTTIKYNLKMIQDDRLSNDFLCGLLEEDYLPRHRAVDILEDFEELIECKLQRSDVFNTLIESAVLTNEQKLHVKKRLLCKSKGDELNFALEKYGYEMVIQLPTKREEREQFAKPEMLGIVETLVNNPLTKLGANDKRRLLNFYISQNCVEGVEIMKNSGMKLTDKDLEKLNEEIENFDKKLQNMKKIIDN